MTTIEAAEGREHVVTTGGDFVADTSTKQATTKERTRSAPPPAGGAVYGLGMIGALVYFLRTAETRQDCVLAVGKAVVWPAILVYLAFKRLGG
jgi:hypothetical protein